MQIVLERKTLLFEGKQIILHVEELVDLTLNIPSLGRQRCLPSWGPRRTPWFFFVISQLFDAVDY